MDEPQAAYEHNGRPVSAAAFYAVACDPRRSVAVEACAGAGKTWMLVSRIVRALLEGVDPNGGGLRVQPHEILAITFTKRAAGEMRQRLQTWLAEFASASPAQLAEALQTRGIEGQYGSQALSRLAEQLSNLYQMVLASGRQVQVRTFHSWFAALLRGAPLAVLQEMGLPPHYELLEDDAPAKALVWRRFYSGLAADSVAAGHLKADFDALVFAHGRFQTEKALDAALDKRTEFGLADAHRVVQRSVLHFTVQYPEYADLAIPEDFWSQRPTERQVMLQAAVVLGRAAARTFSEKGVALEAALAENDVDGITAALLTDKGQGRKFSDKLLGIEQVRAAQTLVLRWVGARQQHAAWLYQQRLTRLTRRLIEDFAALKRERGWVDMNDVERAALVMLADPVLSGWVQERLDARIKHLLIDEFQDTNPLQWQALRSWLSGYAGAGGQRPSVFLVGDPKQSIYRFRRAEPQVFQAAQAFVRDGLGGDLLSCDHTRRNARTVIATVNQVMGQAVLTDAYPGFRLHTTDSVHVGLVQKLPQTPRVPARSSAEADPMPAESEHWRDSLLTPRELPEDSLRAQEARQAAAWIAQQLAAWQASGSDLGPADVMVLSRKRAGLVPLQDELRRLQIAAYVGEKCDLIECCEVQDMVALLDVLVSPQHDLSLARALKSPLFGLDDSALVSLAVARRDEPITWFSLLQKTQLKTYDGREVSADLMRWKVWLETLPPHDALQAIYTDGDVLARFAVAAPPSQRDTVLANLRALLGVSLQLGGGRYATPYAFVRVLKAGGVLAPPAPASQAVRLLTVHGAKGLEAHVVLLLDADSPERKAETMGVLVDWPGEAPAPARFVFLASESEPPACVVDALAVERREREREELNTLYVAMTRARHTLALSSIEPHQPTGGSWWSRLASLADAAAIGAPPVPGSDTPDLAMALDSFDLMTLPQCPTAPELPSHGSRLDGELPVGDAASAAADSLLARLGLALHRMLEWGNSSAPAVRAAAQEFGLDAEQGALAAMMAKAIVQGEAAWAWDPKVLAWAGNEVTLIHQGQTLRLDRLVQRRDPGHSGHWWVLDYKSTPTPQQQPALVAQLRQYQVAVQAACPGAVVHAAFLTARGAMMVLEQDNEI